MNMKKLLSILSIACLTLFPSCNDWLDVTPQGQVEAEELYETTQGCNSVVTGIYHTLSSSSLFGQNLSYGLIDIMAQYWDFSTNTSHIYYPATQFDYDDTNVDGQITTMWQQLYYAITQCNAFIDYSDPYKENIKHYDLLLGEVYGLRALAHMTLFELYGPVIHSTADLQKSAIAYRTEYNNVSKNFDTGEVVLQKAAEDLNRAIELFAEDPIRDPENSRRADLNTSVLDYEDVLNFRGARMNYFCALGLMARLEMLRKTYSAVGFVCGEDFRFGSRGAGSADTLAGYCREAGLPWAVIPEQTRDGIRVSSTYIRRQLESGDMKTAVAFLGHPHILRGTVVHGQALGRRLGIPTANLLLPPELAVPKFGVYACRARVNGGVYPAVANIGTRPTVSGHTITVEPWILDYTGDLYGQQITLEFFYFIRPERKFPDLEALKEEIHRNAQQTRDFFAAMEK